MPKAFPCTKLGCNVGAVGHDTLHTMPAAFCLADGLVYECVIAEYMGE